MLAADSATLDLSPPAFHEGLDDWSRGDGTPDSPTYEAVRHARLIPDDERFGPCLEMRKIDPVQSLRYMGEVPVRAGRYLEISARLRVMRGPVPLVRIAAWPGGARARLVRGPLPMGPLVRPRAGGAVAVARAVVGPERRAGVDLVWDARVIYAHVGLDLVGPEGGVVRIESVALRDISVTFEAAPIRAISISSQTGSSVG